MRDLIANTRDLWYATYTGDTLETDANGDYTGEKKKGYTNPVHFKANLSATRGTQGFTGTGVSFDYFGADVDYHLIISTARMDLPIDEYSIIWTEKPVKDAGGKYDPDTANFRVTAVARGLKHMKYAIKRIARDGDVE